MPRPERLPYRHRPQPERLQHVAGERLCGRDLQDAVLCEAGWRQLHVRAVHGVWGVALGCAVALTPTGRSVQVAPGLAYDACGRELLLAGAHVMPAPAAPQHSGAAAWWFDLLLRAGPDAKAALRWSFAADAPSAYGGIGSLADEVRLGQEVPLARVRVRADGRITHLDFGLRRVARGLARPRIGGGRLAAGAATIDGSVWDWTVPVDSSSGGFSTETPFYFATLAEHPWLSLASGLADIFARAGYTEGELAGLLGPFVTVEKVARSGFVARVRSAAAPLVAPHVIPLLDRVPLPVPLDWIGIEPDTGVADGGANQP